MVLSQVNRNERKYLRSGNSELSKLTHFFDCMYQTLLHSLNCSQILGPRIKTENTKFIHRISTPLCVRSQLVLLLFCEVSALQTKNCISFAPNTKCKSNVCKMFIDNLLIRWRCSNFGGQNKRSQCL